MPEKPTERQIEDRPTDLATDRQDRSIDTTDRTLRQILDSGSELNIFLIDYDFISQNKNSYNVFRFFLNIILNLKIVEDRHWHTALFQHQI